jgi:hypothetical protein
MAVQPHAAVNPSNTTPPAGSTPPPYSAHPGGMASDPANALANEIVTSITGAGERFRSQVESTPALKSLFDQANTSLVAEVTQTIRRFVDAEVAKATGGIAPAQQEKKPS